MTVGKHRCTNCKCYFDAESDEWKRSPAGNFHNKDCRFEYGMKKTDKVIKSAKDHKKKVNARQKKSHYDNDLRTREKAARATCHRYIKIRDRLRAERLEIPFTCICCDISLVGKPAKGVHAGHFHESGNNPLIRYDEDNIHLQSGHCNQFRGGDSGDYRANLIKKIGLARVERLDGLKGGTMKRTCDDYREIEQYYKAKIKALESQPLNLRLALASPKHLFVSCGG